MTVRLIAVVWTSEPLVPVTVTVANPTAAVLDAVRVRDELFPVLESGLKAAETPVGRPVAANVTDPVKPPARVILIVLVPVPP